MPMGLQAKLLRVLQEREVERVGGKKPIALDIRVLSTSNRDMLREVQAGRFREDLYYRLNVFPVEIPSLRERPADILPLARYFIARHGERIGKTAKIAGNAAEILAAWRWPGNVRELENVMERAVILTIGSSITPAVIPLRGAITAAFAAEQHFSAAPKPQMVPLEEMERRHIEAVLRGTGYHKSRTAEILKISRRTLDRRIADFGLMDPEA